MACYFLVDMLLEGGVGLSVRARRSRLHWHWGECDYETALLCIVMLDVHYCEAVAQETSGFLIPNPPDSR